MINKVPNKIILKIDKLTLFYQQENVFRIRDYFFDQFLDAITGESVEEAGNDKWFLKRDSELQSLDFTNKDYNELGYNRKSGFINKHDEDPELHQNSVVEILLNKPKIYLNDRPHFEEAIVFETDYIKMKNGIDFGKGRWYEIPEKL